jgi:hypothetical protein
MYIFVLKITAQFLGKQSCGTDDLHRVVVELSAPNLCSHTLSGLITSCNIL